MLGTFNQPFHEFDQRLRIHPVFVNHKADFALVGYRRNQINALASGMKPNGGCLPTGSITPPMIAIVTQPGFIAPMDFCLFFLSPLSNLRIVLLQPGFHGFRILPVGPFQWLLGRKAPSFQVFAHGSNRHFNGPQLLDQLLNRDACPQREG